MWLRLLKRFRPKKRLNKTFFQRFYSTTGILTGELYLNVSDTLKYPYAYE